MALLVPNGTAVARPSDGFAYATRLRFAHDLPVPIYLDNAATSFPKPGSVCNAIDAANRNFAVAAGRGNYQRANDSNRLLQQARQAIVQLVNGCLDKDVSFAFSGTDALSTAILGYLKPGDHAIATAADHTSVLRPLWHLQHRRDVELTIVPCDSIGVVDATEIESACKPNTKLICLPHANNVTGAVQPVEAVGKICRGNDAAVLVDAAQTAGHLPINVEDFACHFVAAPGHKGLFGPMGTGFLYACESVAQKCDPLRFGGTGSTGNEFEQPQTRPQKFESGNLNIPGIAGLLAGLEWVKKEESIQRLESLITMSQELADRLRKIDGVIVYSPNEIQTPTISFNIDGVDCQTVGMLLESQFEIECRTGLHCAPLIHKMIGSDSLGGTVRFSPGVFTTQVEFDRAIVAVKAIAKEMGAIR